METNQRTKRRTEKIGVFEMIKKYPDIKCRCEKCEAVIWKWESYNGGYCSGVGCDVIKANILVGWVIFVLMIGLCAGVHSVWLLR